MAELPFLPLATDAWVADTQHLTRIERGLYHDLLVLMWRTPGCRVPADIDWLARKLRADESERPALQSIIDEFCKSDGNWWAQKRLSKEHARALESVQKQRDRAKSRWEKEKDQCHGNADAASVCSAPTPTPTPTYSDTNVSAQEPVEIDPAKVAFDGGVALLGKSGVTAAKARPLIGKWRRDHGDEALIAALGKAQREGAIDPVSFIEGCFRARRRDADPLSLKATRPVL